MLLKSSEGTCYSNADFCLFSLSQSSVCGLREGMEESGAWQRHRTGEVP